MSETLPTSSHVLFPTEKTETQKGQGLGYSLTTMKCTAELGTQTSCTNNLFYLLLVMPH